MIYKELAGVNVRILKTILISAIIALKPLVLSNFYHLSFEILLSKINGVELRILQSFIFG
jgi:hypothetical protein